MLLFQDTSKLARWKQRIVRELLEEVQEEAIRLTLYHSGCLSIQVPLGLYINVFTYVTLPPGVVPGTGAFRGLRSWH